MNTSIALAEMEKQIQSVQTMQVENVDPDEQKYAYSFSIHLGLLKQVTDQWIKFSREKNKLEGRESV